MDRISLAKYGLTFCAAVWLAAEVVIRLTQA